MRVRLQGCDEPVDIECDHAGADPDPAAMFAHSLPHKPGAADLGHAATKQDNRADDGHGPTADRSSGASRPTVMRPQAAPVAQPR